VPEAQTVGDRIAELRARRALTQEELAERSGVSVATIRKLEQNERTSARMSTLHRLATALRITTSDLLRPSPVLTGPPCEPDQIALRSLRGQLTPPRSLTGYLLADAETEPPSLDSVAASWQVAHRLYVAGQYSAAVEATASLLSELRLAESVVDGDAERGRWYRLSARSHDLVALLLTQLRLFDLAYLAVDRAIAAADANGDKVLGAEPLSTLAFLLLRSGRLDDAARVATMGAEEIEPRLSSAPVPHIAAWGHLTLWASSAMARDSQHDGADEMLSLAGAAATRIARFRDQFLVPFSPARVAIQSVENAVVQGEPDRALVLAEQHNPPDEADARKWHRYLLNVSDAQAELRRYGDATETLTRVYRAVPEWLRYQRYARETVSSLVKKRKRAISTELRELADFLRVH
jgi:transcriptional regulator with XRE-family HTH domain